MWRNYFVTAARNLAKNRLYSAINIGGLAVGLAACLLIVLFVRDEVSYDKWLPNADRIGKLEITFSVPGREPLSFSQTPGPLRAALEKDYSSDIQGAVRIFTGQNAVRIGDRQFLGDLSWVDAGFFEVFDLPLVAGEREAGLANNSRILLTAKAAEKYFGRGPAVGQTMSVDKWEFTVAGVLADIPANSHLQFEMIALLDPERFKHWPALLESWTSANNHTYALFRSPEAMARVNAEMPAFVDRNVKLDIPGFDEPPSHYVALDVMPVLDIHLFARKGGYFKPGGDIRIVYAFSAVALLILIIACINFVNLATARSMKRAREVALRKVVGATRGQLIRQHLGEAVLTALLALALALALAELALAPYNSLLAKELSLDVTRDPMLILFAVGLVAIVGVIGGLYPAIYLSRFRPATVLKANQSSASGSPTLRNALVVFQFAISIALIVCTTVIYAQTRYARGIELGFQAEEKLIVEGLDDMNNDALKPTLRQEIAALPGVRGASLSSDSPPQSSNNNTLLYRQPVPDNEKLVIETMSVDWDFFPVYGVTPVAGRLFSRDFPTDRRNVPEDKSKQATQAILVNETFVKKLGYPSPEAAVGQVLYDPVGDLKDQRLARTTIIGVVPDMHLRSVRIEITPMAFNLTDDDKDFGVVSVSVEPGRMREVRAAVEGVWKRLVPSVPVRTSFVDDKIAALYDGEAQRAKLFGAFAIFAVLIACLGLYGLASFAAERRTKEIGLRKVMGARVFDIVRLLVWQFSKPVFVANLIAWPIAFYVMNRWLAGFRYAIDLKTPILFAAIFGGAGLIALLIAWATVAGHAIKVASSSPIHALRCE